MRTSLTRLGVAVVTAAVALSTVAAADDAGPAGHFDEEWEVFFPYQEAWFTATSSGIGNIDFLSGELISWSAEAPTGESGMSIMNNYSTFAGDRYQQTFTAEGTFTGPIDTIAVDFYYDQPQDTIGLDALAFDLRIDGETILFQGQSEPSAGLRGSADGDYGVLHFVFTRVHEFMWENDILGDDDTEHTIFLNASNFYAGNEATAHYGGADAPAKITFNAQPQGRRGRWVNYTEIDVYDPPPPLS